MAMINYTNKVALNTNSGVADINKGNANDWNEIKNAFNIQVAQGWYNIGVTALLTLTYVSFNSTTKIGVIASNLDLTPYLSVGMKFKFTQNSAVKYGIIVAISSTQITLFMGQSYTLNNSGISNPFYSMVENPYGFSRSLNAIGNVIITNTNENPSNRLGGTWELIDKEFKSMADNNNNYFNVNSTNCLINNFYVTRSGHSISVRFNFDNKVNLSDTTVNLGSFNFANLGITSLPFSLIYLVGTTDEGNGIFMVNVGLDDGSTDVVDVVTKTSGGTIPSNISSYLLFEFTVTYDRMIDNFCDKFYWKRTG